MKSKTTAEWGKLIREHEDEIRDEIWNCHRAAWAEYSDRFIAIATMDEDGKIYGCRYVEKGVMSAEVRNGEAIYIAAFPCLSESGLSSDDIVACLSDEDRKACEKWLEENEGGSVWDWDAGKAVDSIVAAAEDREPVMEAWEELCREYPDTDPYEPER